MNIFQVFSLELLIAVSLIITYAFFNDRFVRIEKAIVRFAKRFLHR